MSSSSLPISGHTVSASTRMESVPACTRHFLYTANSATSATVNATASATDSASSIVVNVFRTAGSPILSALSGIAGLGGGGGDGSGDGG